jgi:hypothetical protein
MITGIKQSIADQTGNFGFQLQLTIADLSQEVYAGFTGHTFVNWSFLNGRIYDNHNFFCGSYLANQQITISGDIGSSFYDYYINGEIVGIGISKPTGLINYAYVLSKSGNRVGYNVSLLDNTPANSVTENIIFYTGQNATGYLNNLSSGNFRVFACSCDNDLIVPISNDTGNIASSSSGIFEAQISGARVGVAYSGDYTFTTNFGTITYPLIFFAAPTGLPTTIFNYTQSAFSSIIGNTGVTYYDGGGISIVTVSGTSYVSSPIRVYLTYVSGSTGNFDTAWTLSTGTNIGNAVNLSGNPTGFFNSSITNFQGNSLYVQISYAPHGSYTTDVALLTISGLNSGIQIYITGQST